jgi:nucleotide-binding universal stress UspA family protein
MEGKMKTIIVPTDFSENAANACEYAIGLAKETGAKVILFHAFHVPVPATDMPVMVVTPEELEIENRRKLEMDASALRGQHAGVSIEIATRAGFAVEEISAIAKEVNADLIVMGIHEMGTIDELLIGSTTTDVMDKTHCPVLVIPANVKFVKPQTIALASDLKDLSDSCSLDIVKELAHLFHAKLDVLTVVKPGKTPSVKEAAAGIRLEHRLEDIDHTHHFPVSDNVQEGIKNYVDQFAPGMLVMVHRKHNFFEKLFGESTTQKAAFHTHIPLLAMRA